MGSPSFSIMRTINYIFIVLYIANILVEAKDSLPKRDRNGKILSVFQVVSFPNDVCVGGSKNGTCYTSEKCSYFESSGTASTGACRAQICPCSNNICQLRLDFETFVITGPSTDTTSVTKILNGAPNDAGGGAATFATQCLTDTFSVTNSQNNNPVICGTNTGEHMYIDSAAACNDLAFQLGNDAVGVGAAAMRSWSIKVTQFDCNSRNLAPDGCTQYFFGGDTGTVRSYNFNNGNGQHLANQNQKICVRKERGNCRICWTTADAADFAVSGMVAMGMIKTCCGYGEDGKKTNFDCVQIPSASKKTPAANTNGFIENQMGFCGEKGLVSINEGVISATICSRRTPFQIRFITDGFEGDMEAKITAGAEKGFQLMYTQFADNC